MALELLAIASGPFLIMFRESLEAALIVVIIATYLDKIGKALLKRYLYLGTGAAIFLSLVVGIGLNVFYGGLSGAAAELFEGTASVTATAVLTYMIIWMSRNAHRIRDELHGKVDVKITEGNIVGIGAIAFVAVLREGIETVLFLTAIAVQEPTATVVGTVLGAAVVVVLAIVMSAQLHKLNLKNIFKYSSVLLFVFAAGLLGYGVHEYIEAAESYGIELGFLAQKPYNINPADTSHPLHEKGAVGSIAKALVGYDGDPEWLRIFAYVGYWIIVGFYLLRTYSPQIPVKR